MIAIPIKDADNAGRDLLVLVIGESDLGEMLRGNPAETDLAALQLGLVDPVVMICYESLAYHRAIFKQAKTEGFAPVLRNLARNFTSRERGPMETGRIRDLIEQLAKSEAAQRVEMVAQDSGVEAAPGSAPAPGPTGPTAEQLAGTLREIFRKAKQS